MAEPYIGEIRLFSFGYAPQGWATCDGQTLKIVQNQALYALLGTTYGGDGATTFKLPDLRGRTALHRSATFQEGKPGGTETIALTTTAQLPAHTHALTAIAVAGSSNVPQGNLLATVQDVSGTKFAYATAKANPATTLAPGSLTSAGASGSHNNVQPSLAINYCIALTGYFPPRS